MMGNFRSLIQELRDAVHQSSTAADRQASSEAMAVRRMKSSGSTVLSAALP